MKQAVILYHSKTGTTKKYAEQISDYLEEKAIEVRLSSIQDFREEILKDVDYLFLGCWTKGLMVLFQHPDAIWKGFAARLPLLRDVNLALFTTYKILTGSMFKNMAQKLDEKSIRPALELKSRDGLLSQSDQRALDGFLRGV
jgi:sulfite reductase alpha subunit-like flavoprotein